MNEHEMSDYVLYKHYAQEFHKEIKKVLGILWEHGLGNDTHLDTLFCSYEKFEKARSVKFQQQVTDVWEHELEMNPKCKWELCEKNRIMYSFFCEAHTKELLANPESLSFGCQVNSGEMTNCIICGKKAKTCSHTSFITTDENYKLGNDKRHCKECGLEVFPFERSTTCYKENEA